MRLTLVLIAFSLSSSALYAGAKYRKDMPTNISPASKQITTEEFPRFEDDLDFDGLSQAINRQLEAFDRRPLKGTLKLGENIYPLSILKTSILRFNEILEKHRDCFKNSATGRELCVQVLNEDIAANFNIFEPVNENLPSETKNTVHFTGYYSPVLEVSKNVDANYPFAIHDSPKNDSLRTLTREEIDFDGKLKGLGSELFYTKNPYELYLMHIEGGGAVEYLDESGNKVRKFLSYTDNNSNKFKFISVYMKEKGYIADAKISTQRRFLAEHPEKWREIYSYCKGYIYFQVTETEPLGMENIPLTDGRSLAQDKKYFPRKGLISFVKAARPVRERGDVVFKSFSRFFIDQDTGSAIKGEARADLYFGFGEEAKLAAEILNNYGKMYYLIAK